MAVAIATDVPQRDRLKNKGFLKKANKVGSENLSEQIARLTFSIGFSGDEDRLLQLTTERQFDDVQLRN